MPELNRDELIKKCGRSIACIHAVEYYIKYMQNPCYPPDRPLTTKARKYFIELMEKYGRPRCDMRKLIEERLRGTAFEKYIDEIVELAERLKKELNTTSRVSAALAVVTTALMKRIYVSKYEVVKMFNVSFASINTSKVHTALRVVHKATT